MNRAVLAAGPRLAQKAKDERRARRRQVTRRLAWLVAGGMPFAAAAWLLLASPWLVVHTVQVRGEGRLSRDQVLAAAHVRLGEPLARVDTGGVAARVKALGPVASVSVHRSWPSTLVLTLVEREPVAAVPAGKQWTLLDGGGAALGTVAALPPKVVLLRVARPGPGDRATVAALRVLQGLPALLRHVVTGVTASSPERVTLVLRDGRQVIWGGTDRAQEKAAALVPLLRMKGHVYDVSAPGVVSRR